jgi:hypothetical protein
MSPTAYPTKRRNRLIAGLCGATLLACTALSVLALTSCGSGAHADGPIRAIRTPRPSLASARCASAMAYAFGDVATHIYQEFAEGRVVEPAVQRLQSSPTLIAAVQSGNPAAVRTALGPLILGQLARVRITVAGRTLAEYGSGAAIAPVTAPLRDAAGVTIGTLVASEQGVDGYVETLSSFIAGQVLVRAGSRQLGGTTTQAPSKLTGGGEVAFAGKRYSVYSLSGTRFPSGPLRVYVLAPNPPASGCARSRAETVADTIGQAGVEIYRQEQSGPRTKLAVRDFEHSRAFREAVLADNPTATHAAIVTFFKTQLHVVRVRATLGEKLVLDLGGPHVLAPVRGDVRNAQGRVVGHFLLSIQDDLGYLLLANRFTGAQVLLRQGSEQIMGTLSPGPAQIPNRGMVVYGGVRYRAYSFVADAFPKGTLRISLLIPAG